MPFISHGGVVWERIQQWYFSRNAISGRKSINGLLTPFWPMGFLFKM
jgi:hypothetical protein